MSHINSYEEVKINDLQLFLDKCRLNGAEVKIATDEPLNVAMYGSQRVNNVAAQVNFPEWRYAVAVDKKGVIHYDHWGSPASSMQYLHKSVQDYCQQHILNHLPLESTSHFTSTNEKNEVVIEINFD